MSLISLVILLVLAGFGLWLINVKGTAIDPTIKKIINVVVIVAVIIIVLFAFGVLPMKDVQVPKIR